MIIKFSLIMAVKMKRAEVFRAGGRASSVHKTLTSASVQPQKQLDEDH